jgi:hypothetical protein
LTIKSLLQGVSMGLEGFREETFTYNGKTREVYRRGAGPGIVVMHEIPGIHPGVISFAERLAAAGFSVAMPVMFGVPGRPVSSGYILKELVHGGIWRGLRSDRDRLVEGQRLRYSARGSLGANASPRRPGRPSDQKGPRSHNRVLRRAVNWVVSDGFGFRELLKRSRAVQLFLLL